MGDFEPFRSCEEATANNQELPGNPGGGQKKREMSDSEKEDHERFKYKPWDHHEAGQGDRPLQIISNFWQVMNRQEHDTEKKPEKPKNWVGDKKKPEKPGKPKTEKKTIKVKEIFNILLKSPLNTVKKPTDKKVLNKKDEPHGKRTYLSEKPQKKKKNSQMILQGVQKDYTWNHERPTGWLKKGSLNGGGPKTNLYEKPEEILKQLAKSTPQSSDRDSSEEEFQETPQKDKTREGSEKDQLKTPSEETNLQMKSTPKTKKRWEQTYTNHLTPKKETTTEEESEVQEAAKKKSN